MAANWGHLGANVQATCSNVRPGAGRMGECAPRGCKFTGWSRKCGGQVRKCARRACTGADCSSKCASQRHKYGWQLGGECLHESRQQKEAQNKSEVTPNPTRNHTFYPSRGRPVCSILDVKSTCRGTLLHQKRGEEHKPGRDDATNHTNANLEVRGKVARRANEPK